MSVQPIDIGGVTFELVFNNTNRRHFIDPPIGWDAMPIELKREGKYARVIKFADGKEISFWKHKPIELGHRFDELAKYHELFADESNVELILYVDGSEMMRCVLDFTKAKTDRESYFTCPIIVNDLNKTVKDLEDTKVDVFGDKSLLGNPNPSAPTDTVILMPKKIRERAVHEMGNSSLTLMETDIELKIGTNGVTASTNAIGNPWGVVVLNQSDIAESYYVDKSQTYVNPNPFPDTYISGALQGTQNLWLKVETELRFNFKDLHIEISGANVTAPNSRILVQMAIITYDNANKDNVINKYYHVVKDANGVKDLTVNESFGLTLPANTRVIYEYRAFTNSRLQTDDDKITIYRGGSISADSIGIYPITNAKMTRLIDAGKKILSSYSEGASIVTADRFTEGGQFWWLYITAGTFIRGFTSMNFDLSFKDWKKFIQNALNCDVQINGNNVFIGRQEDFYTNKEVARFEFKPDLDSYEITLNEDLIINKLDFKYTKFESDKKDTLDAFHTESEWYIPRRNKGELVVDVNFIADGYSIEYARREGIESEPTTAKDKDNDVYIIDCIQIQRYIPLIGYIDYIQNRQNQGFEVDESTVFSPETLYNIRLSIKRLILDNYGHRIAEIGQKLNNGVPTPTTEMLINTFFNANGEVRTNATDYELKTFIGWIKENANVLKSQLKQPIISTEIYTFTLSQRLKYNSLISMYNRIISEKGYITLYTAEKEMKFYATEMSYDWAKELLTFKGERKI